jgi:glucokinase
MRIVKADPQIDPGWPRLLGDIGGTNARFGWLSGPHATIEHIQVLSCARYPGLDKAIEAYLQQEALPIPHTASLAMAIPVTGDVLQMTNLSWRFSMQEILAQLELECLMVLNDFTALALALPELLDRHLIALKPLQAQTHAQPLTKALLGAGTGLGVSGLLPVPGSNRWVPLMGEGGHVTLAAQSRLEFEVIESLSERHGHVSAERVLCGNGLVDVYQTLRSFQGQSPLEGLVPSRILELEARGDELADQTLSLFVAWMGSVAGDLALTLGALGGVYIGGGIAPRLRHRFEGAEFQKRFESKGRYRAYLQSIPIWLIDAPFSPALQGAALAIA